MLGELKLKKLYNVTCTVRQMIHDRGFVVNTTGPLSAVGANGAPERLSYQQFLSIVRPGTDDAIIAGVEANRAPLAMICTPSTSTAASAPVRTCEARRLLAVFVGGDSALSHRVVADCRRDGQALGADWVIVVSSGKIPAALRKEVSEGNVAYTHLKRKQPAEGASAEPVVRNPLIGDVTEHTVGDAAAEAALIQKKKEKREKKAAAAAPRSNVAPPAATVADEDAPLSALAAATPAPAEEAPVFVELFEEDVLTFSPLQHSMTPRHTVLKEAEVAELLTKKGATLEKLPRMLYGDPIARYFGLPRGSVLKITRDAQSDVVGEHDTYRHVI